MADDFSYLHSVCHPVLPRGFQGAEAHHEPYCFTAPVFPFKQYQPIMFTGSVPPSPSLLFGPSLPAPSRFCALRGFCCSSGSHSGILFQPQHSFHHVDSKKTCSCPLRTVNPPCCSRLKFSLFVCVPGGSCTPGCSGTCR